MAEPTRAIEMRPPEPRDIPAIDELYRVVKGRGRSGHVTRHRLFDTPWGHSPALIALDGERVVSTVIVWPVEIRVGEDLVLGGQGTDAATHPDYRNRPRLFVSLAQATKLVLQERGVAVYYTFPNARSIKLTKHVGGTYLGTITASGVELSGRRLPRFRKPRLDGELSVHAAITDAVTRLIATTHAARDVIRVEKSRRWLDWRYAEASGELAEWFVLHEGGEVTAAALAGERDTALWGEDFAGLVRVHELFAASESSCEALLRHVVAHARGAGARKVDVLVKDPVLERGVERAGFKPESERPITSTLLRDGLRPNALEFGPWRIVSGDMDFF